MFGTDDKPVERYGFEPVFAKEKPKLPLQGQQTAPAQATDWSKFVPDQPTAPSTIDDFIDGKAAPAAAAPWTKFQPEQPSSIDGFLGTEQPGVIGTLAQGLRATGRAVGAAGDMALGDRSSVVERAKAQAAAPKNANLRAFEDEIARRRADLGTNDPSILDALGVVGGAVLAQPKGAGLAVLEQAPNSLAVLGPAWAGAKLGATVGAAIPVPGAPPALGVAGGLAGMFLGNTAVETGNRALQAASDGEFTPEESAKAFQEGGTKGAAITGIDAATLGVSKWIMGATSRAVERATQRALIDAGVDVTNEVALLAARRSPEVVQAVRQAQQAAIDTTTTFGQKAARAGAALGLETVGEGLGEYLGELAATGQADTIEAVLESVMSLGQSGAEVAWGASKNAAALAAARLDPNAGPNSRAAIAALRQQAAGNLPPIPAAAGTMQQASAAGIGGDSNNQVPTDWAQGVDAALGGVPAQAQPMASPWSQYEQQAPTQAQPEQRTIENFLGTAPDTNQASIENFLGTAPETAPPSATPEPQSAGARLVPLKDEAAAAKRAQVVTQRTGQQQIVIPHPDVPGRFAVVPVDSPLAATATATAAPYGLNVEGLFRTQQPVPLKNARKLAGLLSAQGREHVIVPSPTGRGFGVAPIESVSPAQLESWARFQSGARRGAARLAPDPVAAPPAAMAVSGTSPSTIESMATPNGTPISGSSLGLATGTATQAAPAVSAASVTGSAPTADTGMKRAAPGTSPTVESSGKPFKTAKAALASAKQQQADLRPVKVAGGWGLLPADQAPTPKPWELSQSDFLALAQIERDGQRWSTRWDGQYLDSADKEFDHPDLGKTIISGDRFFKTQREAKKVARAAHKRAVEGALRRGEQVAPDALAAYPDLQPTLDAAPGDQAQNDAAPSRAPYAIVKTRLDTTEKQREVGRSAVRDLARRIEARLQRAGNRQDRTAITVLGNRLYDGFVFDGGVDLVGQKVSSPEDLATLAQVFRDPRFETFRVFYIDAQGAIVGEAAYSSRLPAAVNLPTDFDAKIRADMARFNAAGFHILHNHPSGRATPSQADIDLTKWISRNTSGFLGHVVIDHNEYSTIDAGGAVQVIQAPQLNGIDFGSKPEIEHTMLGSKMNGPMDVVLAAKALQVKDGHAALIFLRRDQTVQLLMDVPMALLQDTSRDAVGKLKGVIRGFARESGAGGWRFLVLPDGVSPQPFKRLVLDNVFTDIVTADGKRAEDFGAVTTGDFLDQSIPVRRVREDTAGRAAFDAVQRRILGMRAQKMGAAVLGSRLMAEINQSGGAQLIGREIRDASDLAILAQIYRNPMFETWRAFYTKDGRVVGESAYSSRLPGVVIHPADITERVKADMAKYGADAVWTSHNHPRGSAQPSAGDANMAYKFARRVPGWKGEVIIANSEYAILTGEGLPDRPADFEDLSRRELRELGIQVIQDPRLASIDFNSAPELEHRLLGLPIGDAADIAKLGKGLQVPDGHAAMIVTAAGKVQALLDVPLAPLQNTKSKLGRAAIMAMARRITRQTGGNARFLVVPKGVKLDPWLVRFGIFRDVVSETGTSTLATIRKRAGNPDLVPMDQIGGNAMRNARQLYEPAGPGYDAAEPGTRRSRNAENIAAEPMQADQVGNFTPERATVKEWIAHQLKQNRGWAMGALTRDQIADIYGGEIPQVDAFDRTVQQMDLIRNQMMEKADALVERWRKLPSKAADRLADVMHAATLAQFDPAEMNATTAEEQQLADEFDALTADAQQVYRDVRDQYRETLIAIRDGLAGRAERTGSTGRAIADEIRLKFDKYLREGPYFSLARFGDFILIADRGNERIVEAFESSLQREKRARGLRAQGFTVKLTAKQQYSATKDGAAGSFIGDVLEKIDALDMDAEQKAALMDGLNQLAISTLPDASYRKHFAHRKGTPGFSNDAMRAFASSQLHAAHHLARIRHADELALLIDDMRADIRELSGDVDVTERQQVVNELTRRLDLMMNPTTHPVTAALGQVGFVMSLGGSIASGITNMTQTPLVTYPWLGSKFGFDKAASALLKASKDYFGGRWDKWAGFVMADSPNLADDERAALRHLEETGLINLTQASDLAGTANTDSTVSKRAFAINRAMKVIGWTFSVPEVFNRQVSALAAYRLAREAGQTHDAAIESARNTLIRTHFDYSASNRARLMSGNVTRVLTMFKQYSQNITYLLWRNAYLALKGESVEVKREARRMLLGVASMHFAAAGTMGLPLGIFGVTPLLALLSMGMGDDDEPFDWETEYRNWLADTFGKEGGEAIAKGPIRMLLNVDMASRVGLNDLWIRPPQKDAEGRDLVEAWMITLLGPVAGYAGQLGTAMKAFEEGKFARGVESMMPKFIAAPLKAIRYETEGVRSWRGDDLGVRLSDADIAGTALGFNPSKLAEMYEGRNAVKGREAALQRRREDLMRQWREARDAGDTAGLEDAVADIRKFNERNRPFAIGPNHLISSWMAARRAQLQTVAGINLNRRRDELREFGRFANIN